jgi:hypothetical protein
MEKEGNVSNINSKNQNYVELYTLLEARGSVVG